MQCTLYLANTAGLQKTYNIKGLKRAGKFKGSTATHLMSRSIGLRVTFVKNFVYFKPQRDFLNKNLFSVSQNNAEFDGLFF